MSKQASHNRKPHQRNLTSRDKREIQKELREELDSRWEVRAPGTTPMSPKEVSRMWSKAEQMPKELP